MKFEDMNNYLIDKFPELREKIDDIIDFFAPEEVPQYVLYEQALNKYIYDVLMKGGEDSVRYRIFNCLEEMAQSKDLEINNLLQVGILEYIWSEEELRDIAVKYMGDKTKCMLEEVKPFFK